jgi:hypothetical protein
MAAYMLKFQRHAAFTRYIRALALVPSVPYRFRPRP